MSCSSGSLTLDSPLSTGAFATAQENERAPLLNRIRRHSYDTLQRRHSSIVDADAVFLRVDLFLTALARRLDWLEKYRQEQLQHSDTKLQRGYAALEAVRDSCSHTSGELIWGAAKKRATILVETLETRYNEVIATKETLEQKAQTGMRLLESSLAELETRVHSPHSQISAAFGEGWKRVDSSLAHTREILDHGYDRARRAKDILTESISQALLRAAETRLIAYEDLPLPWRVNPYIMRGYRFTESKIECVTSIFRPSNESVNIWSHAIGLVIVLSIAFHFYPTSETFPLSTKTDVFIAACFFFAACKCLTCSIMWHTMNGIAEKKTLDRFACVDYTGISFLVAASILSTEWTAFYCEPISRTVYMLATAVLGIAGTALPWHPTFNRADMAWARVAFFVTLAATGLAPIIQLNITRGPAWSFYFYAPIAKSMLVYLTGAIIYAAQVPEKWWPGFFDYAGGSHNIWHLAVLGGILFHYTAMIQFFNGAFRRAAAEGGCTTI